MRYYPAVGPAIPRGEVGRSRVTHPFAGCPLRDPLDLHVLSTPPAFVLSQDQTLQENSIAPRTRSIETRGLNRHASGINNFVIISLAAEHDLCSSTRAIARMSHSIVKQQFLRPQGFWGTLSIVRQFEGARARAMEFPRLPRTAISHFQSSPQHSTHHARPRNSHASRRG